VTKNNNSVTGRRVAYRCSILILSLALPGSLPQLLNQLPEGTADTETAVLELGAHFANFILEGVWGRQAQTERSCALDFQLLPQ